MKVLGDAKGEIVIKLNVQIDGKLLVQYCNRRHLLCVCEQFRNMKVHITTLQCCIITLQLLVFYIEVFSNFQKKYGFK